MSVASWSIIRSGPVSDDAGGHEELGHGTDGQGDIPVVGVGVAARAVVAPGVAQGDVGGAPLVFPSGGDGVGVLADQRDVVDAGDGADGDAFARGEGVGDGVVEVAGVDTGSGDAQGGEDASEPAIVEGGIAPGVGADFGVGLFEDGGPLVAGGAGVGVVEATAVGATRGEVAIDTDVGGGAVLLEGDGVGAITEVDREFTQAVGAAEGEGLEGTDEEAVSDEAWVTSVMDRTIRISPPAV